jgi:hypothetical protein
MIGWSDYVAVGEKMETGRRQMSNKPEKLTGLSVENHQIFCRFRISKFAC